ncbi:MAG: class I SAM-dependent methyltransferase [Rhodospirillaceae bacterium]|nr:class I SAM-dependent methyltransferase [Rhodospirillaceae bacterium]MBT4427163.1 class I SAM-dependent methyltransferase [Rhodospirillaceae bacterium]MBT5038813.1 class I SAM-dependent methyltransferase [Rhodospirillaceae bacterium]MBT6828084.1 class I SAM-dependent methyltransferase [Rhodospirillaceae bacterium]
MNKRATYQRIAKWYDLLDAPFERKRYQPLRPLLFQGLSGRVLDAGVGTGRNIPFYPKASEMVGIDLSPAMLARAEGRRVEVAGEVQLLEMDVMHTSFEDNSFDAVVSSFLFCVLEPEHQLPALKELARICKPGGEIRLLEYSYSQDPRKRFVMKLWAPWVRWAYGAAFDRNTHQYLGDAGLEEVENRFLVEDIVRLIVARP